MSDAVWVGDERMKWPAMLAVYGSLNLLYSNQLGAERCHIGLDQCDIFNHFLTLSPKPAPQI